MLIPVPSPTLPLSSLAQTHISTGHYTFTPDISCAGRFAVEIWVHLHANSGFAECRRVPRVRGDQMVEPRVTPDPNLNVFAFSLDILNFANHTILLSGQPLPFPSSLKKDCLRLYIHPSMHQMFCKHYLKLQPISICQSGTRVSAKLDTFDQFAIFSLCAIVRWYIYQRKLGAAKDCWSKSSKQFAPFCIGLVPDSLCWFQD